MTNYFREPWYKSFWKVVLVTLGGLLLLFLVWFGVLFLQAFKTVTQPASTTTTAATNSLTTTSSIAQTLAQDVDDDPSLGPEIATVVIIAFEDFQCPFCQAGEPIIMEVLQQYPDDVRFVYRDFPLYTIHKQATAAAQAAECADEQGKFWEWHDLAFANQVQLPVSGIFSQWAEQAGLDVAEFDICVAEDRYQSEVQQDIDEGVLIGVEATPTYFVNGQKVTGVLSRQAWIEVIETLLP